VNTSPLIRDLLSAAKSNAERRRVLRSLHNDLLRAAREIGEPLSELPASDKPLPENMTYNSQRKRYIYRIQEGGREFKRVLGKTRAEAERTYLAFKGQIATARLTSKSLSEVSAFRKPALNDDAFFVDACEHAGITFTNRRGGMNPHIPKFFERKRLRDIDETTIRQFILFLLEHNCCDSYIEKILWQLNKALRHACRGRNLVNAMQTIIDGLEPKQRFRSIWRPIDSSKQTDILRAAAAARVPNSKTRKTTKGELTSELIHFMIRKAKEYGDLDKYGVHHFSNFHRRSLFGDELVLFCWLLLYTAQRFTAIRRLTFTESTSGNYVRFADNTIVLNDNKTGTVVIAIHPDLKIMLEDRYRQQQILHRDKKEIPVFDTLPVGVSKLMRRFFKYCGWANFEPYGTIKGTVISKVVALSGGRAKTAASAVGITPQVIQKHYERISTDNPLLKLDYGRTNIVPPADNAHCNGNTGN